MPGILLPVPNTERRYIMTMLKIMVLHGTFCSQWAKLGQRVNMNDDRPPRFKSEPVGKIMTECSVV